MYLEKIKTLIRKAGSIVYPENSLGTCNKTVDASNDVSYNRRTDDSGNYNGVVNVKCPCGTEFRASNTIRTGQYPRHCRSCIIKLIN